MSMPSTQAASPRIHSVEVVVVFMQLGWWSRAGVVSMTAAGYSSIEDVVGMVAIDY